MGMPTSIEFYLTGSEKNLSVVKSEAVPRSGEFINIRGLTYRVLRVTWAVDDANDARTCRMRANVEIETAK